jgi:TrmH family RNA methyltransferase
MLAAAGDVHVDSPIVRVLRMPMRPVTSRQNPVVRAFRALGAAPDVEGARLLLDGVHLVRDAHQAGLAFETVAIATSRVDGPTEEHRLASRLEREGVDVVTVSDQVLRAMSPVQHPSGLVAIARRRPVRPADIIARPDAFILAVSDVQDPGNLGSLLRAAEAGGVRGALVCGRSASPFSWKALRGGMGSTLRLPVATGLTIDEAIELLGRAGVRSVAAVPRSGQDPDAVSWSGAVALLLGGEGPGLPTAVVARCDAIVTVPMVPAVESLNVAVAAGVLIYAARRQRAATKRPTQAVSSAEALH